MSDQLVWRYIVLINTLLFCLMGIFVFSDMHLVGKEFGYFLFFISLFILIVAQFYETCYIIKHRNEDPGWILCLFMLFIFGFFYLLYRYSLGYKDRLSLIDID